MTADDHNHDYDVHFVAKGGTEKNEVLSRVGRGGERGKGMLVP